jgi:hypothetical protein
VWGDQTGSGAVTIDPDDNPWRTLAEEWPEFWKLFGMLIVDEDRVDRAAGAALRCWAAAARSGTGILGGPAAVVEATTHTLNELGDGYAMAAIG